jgi:hypothetical protein
VRADIHDLEGDVQSKSREGDRVESGRICTALRGVVAAYVRTSAARRAGMWGGKLFGGHTCRRSC